MSKSTNASGAQARLSIREWLHDNAYDFTWMVFMVGLVILFAYFKNNQLPTP